MEFGFIECHEKDTGVRVLVPLGKILSISQCPEDLTGFIETHLDMDGNGIGIYTKELYVELLLQIRKMVCKSA